MTKGRPPLRFASQTTSPSLDGGEEECELSSVGPLPHPPLGGEVSARSDDGVGVASRNGRSRREVGTTQRARSFRQGDNQAEALLWSELKNSQLGGHKFTRQFPIGPYFADFCCRKEKLVVELDGSQHAESEYDRRRDAFMREQGYSVMRFWSHEVLKQKRAICETILSALDGRLAEDVAASDLRFVFARGRAG